MDHVCLNPVCIAQSLLLRSPARRYLEFIFASPSHNTMMPSWSQVKAQLNEAGDLLTKQVPQASARVGMGTVEALKGAASNTEIGNPVKEAVGSLQQVRDNVDAI